MRPRILAGFALGALVTAFAAPASADTTAAACDPSTLTCSVGTASLKGTIKSTLGTEIDSGWMDKGDIKIRTRFTIDPSGGDPLVSVDMPTGALIDASWPNKGEIQLKTRTDKNAAGTMNVHYTLTPHLEANIYGISLDYDANSLLNKIPGASFNYDVQAKTNLLPWGFTTTSLTMPAPALNQSTLFSLGFDQLGVDSGIAEGTLKIQAAAKPIFKYTTKEVRIGSGSVTGADGIAKIGAIDDDAMDLQAYVSGQIDLDGTLDVQPVVTVDSVAGYPTFGLVKFSFSVVTKSLAGMPAAPVSFEQVKLHIPLPNVKVPADGLDLRNAQSVTVQNTGEMDAMLTFTSSDPAFTVPSGQVKVTSKGTYDLKVSYSGQNAATATITVKSNDPDSPE
ncbi:MAG TPA: hypothetical protein VIF62_18520, partial [Labilithrix sp.]